MMDAPVMQHFGDFLQAYFRLMGFRTQDAALQYLKSRGVQVSRSSISWYLSGTRRPGRGRMEAILDALDVPMEARLRAYALAASAPVDTSKSSS